MWRKCDTGFPSGKLLGSAYHGGLSQGGYRDIPPLDCDGFIGLRAPRGTIKAVELVERNLLGRDRIMRDRTGDEGQTHEGSSWHAAPWGGTMAGLLGLASTGASAQALHGAPYSLFVAHVVRADRCCTATRIERQPTFVMSHPAYLPAPPYRYAEERYFVREWTSRAEISPGLLWAQRRRAGTSHPE
jgi:hypothetical protein